MNYHGHLLNKNKLLLILYNGLIFSPAEIKDEEFDKFQSLELKATRVINSITGLNLRFPETERSVNMCQAVQEMCDDARAEGRTQGFTEGESIGLQKQALLTAQKMLKDGRFTLEDISNFSGLPLDEVKKLQMK
ncbi:MAG: hypothetical protein Q4P27_11365 [Eubacteriales bacterium]|nr:hypothetical protein [Eubacteriales bacterium]